MSSSSNDSPDSSKSGLSLADLRERLKVIDSEVSKLEQEVAASIALRDENSDLNLRIDRMQRALFGLLHHVSHPSKAEIINKRLEILKGDLDLY